MSALADPEGLTFYDAVCLELAIRRGLTLATGDKALRRGAVQRGVPLALPRIRKPFLHHCGVSCRRPPCPT